MENIIVTKEEETERIKRGAHELHESVVREYESAGAFKKMIAVISGKKPKNNLSKEEILAKYSGEAEYLLRKPIIEKKISELESEKNRIREWLKNNPSEANYVIQDLYFAPLDKKIADLLNELAEYESKRLTR